MIKWELYMSFPLINLIVPTDTFPDMYLTNLCQRKKLNYMYLIP